MSRRMDVIVVGAGVVGASCAVGLARAGLQVALVEANAPTAWTAGAHDLRVFAIAPDNVALLDAVGVWEDIARRRAQPYRRMHVWDAGGGDALIFDADAMARRELGWIVENSLLVTQLWEALPRAGVDVQCPVRVDALTQDASGVRVALTNGRTLEAKLLIAADGARSAVRQQLGVSTADYDYQQQGVVAYIATEQPHAQTAWQRFLPTGPLAVLPCTQERTSIVWSLPNADAERVLALDENSFNRELTLAFAARLGAMRLDSARAAFPLKRRLAKAMRERRVLLMGDAAHTVHPLAGQGVNLGLRDVAAFLRSVRDAQATQRPFDSDARLARWARERRSDNTVSALAFETIHRVWSNDAVLPTLLRGHAFGVAQRISPLRHALWRHAAGV